MGEGVDPSNVPATGDSRVRSIVTPPVGHRVSGVFPGEAKLPGTDKTSDTPTQIVHTGLDDVARCISELDGIIEARRDQFAQLHHQALQTPFFQGSDYPSLHIIPDISKQFEPITGAIRLPAESVGAVQGFFHTPDRVHKRAANVVENRGARYYVSLDPHLSPTEKLRSMAVDIEDAFGALEHVDRGSHAPGDFIATLGVLDYLKCHAISLYHAVTYKERVGEFRSDGPYEQVKRQVEELTDTMVRMFYQHASGNAFDLPIEDLGVVRAATRSVVGFLEREGLEERQFKGQEVDHPLLIAANALANAQCHSDVEVVVGIPLGGLQPSIATRLAYEMVHGRKPDLIQIPLSTHNGASWNTHHISAGQVAGLLARHRVYGRDVLAVDDNSNTGLTLAIMEEGVGLAGASGFEASLVELDPRRMQLKHDLGTLKTCTNLDRANFVTAVGFVPIRSISAQQEGQVVTTDQQARKAYAQRVIEMARRDLN